VEFMPCHFASGTIEARMSLGIKRQDIRQVSFTKSTIAILSRSSQDGVYIPIDDMYPKDLQKTEEG